LWGTRQEHKQSGHSPPANAHSRPDASGAAGERRRIAAAARHWRRRWRRTGGWWLAPAAGSSRSGTTATAPRCVPFPPLFRALLALTPLCPVALRFARGTPSICRAAVRRRADCVGSASDWRPVPSLCRIPRFCCVGVGGFRCRVLVEWRVDWFHCSPRHLLATVVLRNAEGILLRWIVQLFWVYHLNFLGTVRILQYVDTNNLFTC
jgi:hypothetical protein